MFRPLSSDPSHFLIDDRQQPFRCPPLIVTPVLYGTPKTYEDSPDDLVVIGHSEAHDSVNRREPMFPKKPQRGPSLDDRGMIQFDCEQTRHFAGN